MWTWLSRHNLGKVFPRATERECVGPIVYLSRAKGGKEKSFRLSATCVSHYGREAFFGRRGVYGETKFRAHAWAFLSARWWSHHRHIQANYYRFRMTTSAHTWSDNARSKRDTRSRFRFISVNSHTDLKMPKSRRETRKGQKILDSKAENIAWQFKRLRRISYANIYGILNI